MITLRQGLRRCVSLSFGVALFHYETHYFTYIVFAQLFISCHECSLQIGDIRPTGDNDIKLQD